MAEAEAAMTWKHLPLLSALVLALPLGAAGCNRSEPRPPVRVVVVERKAALTLAAEALGAGLTARSADGGIIPALAQSWRVSDDGLSVLFRLRPAHFADGQPVTADDVVTSFERARSRNRPLSGLMGGITRLSAPLPEVVELTLSTPQPELLELLAMPELAIHPRRGGHRAPGAFRVTGQPVLPAAVPAKSARGSAPHAALAEIVFPLTLVRNPQAAVPSPGGNATIMLDIAAPGEAVRRFQQGQADVVYGARLQGFTDARILARRNTLLLEPARAVLMLLVNERDGPLADPRIRRALALALDREGLALRLFGSAAAAAVPGLVPPGIPGARPPVLLAPLDERRAEARQLLQAAGVTLPFHVALSAGNSSEEERLARLIAADLAPLGIEIGLARRSPQAQAAAVANGDFTLALVERWSPINSPLAFLLPLRCGANRHGVCVAQADRLLAEAWAAPTLAARQAAYAEAERLWIEDGGAIGLIQPLAWALVSPRVTGFEANAMGVHPLVAVGIEPRRAHLLDGR
jgi:ABC-type transport system substrate-binding protein